MIQFSLKIAVVFSIVVAAFTSVGQQAIAQDHFIGEGQTVNRVIKLKSTSTQKVQPKRILDKTSRGDVDKRQTKAVANPNQIQFDEIQVPKTLQQRSRPVVSQQPETTPNVFQQVKTSLPPTSNMMTTGSVSTMSSSSTTKTMLPAEQVNITKQLVATEIRAPRFVNVDQNARVQISLRNMGEEDVNNVRLVTILPPYVKFVSSNPQPTQIDGQQHVFVVSKINASKMQQVVMNVVPTQKLPLDISTQMVVENRQSMVVGVQQPQLSINIDGPSQTTTGKTVSHRATITNVGDGVATDIQVETMLPSTLQQAKSVSGVIPEIQPGESVKVQLDSRALTAGAGALQVVAKSATTKTEQATMDVVVFQPELRLSAAGPKINFVERDGIYSINVENTGEVDVTNVEVSLMVPDGMKVTTISRQADVDEITGGLVWHFDRLAAKTNEQIQMKATALKEGQQVCNIRIKSDETMDKEFLLATQVSTRADLSVRIKNQTGPVQVGATAEFIVEVENHGSRQASGINVKVALPDSLIPAKDSKNVSQFGNALTFEQAMIGAGEKVAFKFTAVGVSQGDHVVRSTLNIANSERSVISEDSIYVYAVDQARISESLTPAVPR